MPLSELPLFKKLELTDRPGIERLEKEFPAYSDFNFTSLWCWDTKNDLTFSVVEGNLAVKFNDYLTGDPFYSFLGKKNQAEAAERLLGMAADRGHKVELRLVPAESVQSLDASKYYIAPDENNFDYLLSTEELSSFKGNKWRAKSNFVNRFKKMYRSKVIELDLGDPSTEKKIKGLFGLWAQKKAPNSKDTKNEGIAISRLLQFSKHFKTESIGLEIEGELVGFSINEITSPSSALLHFEKANLNFVGVYAYLMQQTAVHLRNKGCTILNYEQDLGLQGLKKAKASYFPVSFLKKYVVSKRR